ncbi:MAG: histidine kinase [Negativicutes bacterium]|jgi:two-component sensor histidine kinase
MRKKTALLLVAILLPMLIVAWQMYREWRPDIALYGVADMRTTFNRDSMFFLRGQWEYYPGKLLAPGQFGGLTPEFVDVPVALGEVFSRRFFSRTGSAGTYRLRLLLPELPARMELDTYMIRSADKIFINGELVVEQGKVATKPDKFVAFSRPAKAAFANRGDNEIVIQVADFCNGAAGIIAAPSFSSETNSFGQRHTELLSDETIIISGGVVFFILLGMFLQHNRQRELVYLGLACLSAIVLVISLSYGKLIFDFLPGLNYKIAMHIKVAGILLVILCAVQYFLLALETKVWLKQFNLCCGLLLTTLALLAPVEWIASLYVMIILSVWGVLLASCLAVLLVCAYVKNNYGTVYLTFGFSGFFSLLIESFFRVIGYVSTPNTVALLLPMILISQLLFLSERHRKQQLGELLRTSEMRSLRSQMNTHFVYNALASIAGMIKTEPNAARRTLVDFSQFFRKLIKPAHDDYNSTLQEELELTKYYLNIEAVRFEQRLNTTIDVPVGLYGLKVPALVIQPLVENSIKHNFEKHNTQTLTLTIMVRREADILFIEICDNGIGMTAEQIRDLDKSNERGIGLRNIRERLRIYGGRLNFTYCAGIMKMTLVIKIIQAEERDA